MIPRAGGWAGGCSAALCRWVLRDWDWGVGVGLLRSPPSTLLGDVYGGSLEETSKVGTVEVFVSSSPCGDESSVFCRNKHMFLLYGLVLCLLKVNNIFDITTMELCQGSINCHPLGSTSSVPIPALILTKWPQLTLVYMTDFGAVSDYQCLFP